MANSYEWTYPQLDRVATEGDNSDVVKTIHWRVTATSDSETDADGNALSATKYGTTSVEMEDGAEFVAYNDLTKDWCKAKVLADMGQTEDEVKAALDADIAEKASPSILTGTPSGW